MAAFQFASAAAYENHLAQYRAGTADFCAAALLYCRPAVPATGCADVSVRRRQSICRYPLARAACRDALHHAGVHGDDHARGDTADPAGGDRQFYAGITADLMAHLPAAAIGRTAAAC